MQRRSFLGSLLALFSPAPAVPGPFKRPTAPYFKRVILGRIAPDTIGHELPPRCCGGVDWYVRYGGSFDTPSRT